MHPSLTYIPPDRLQALAHGIALPNRALGAVLSVDISGFTRLTDLLVGAMGVRQGAEYLGTVLNHVYEILIAPVEVYGGSVISFSGDGMRCWFPRDPGDLAVACGCAMQAAMTQLGQLEFMPDQPWHLRLKGAVASGDVYRFCLGDPQIQYLDTLAGPVMTRLGVIETLAQHDELIVDTATATNLAGRLHYREWRTAADGSIQAGIVDRDRLPTLEYTAMPTLVRALNPALLQPWMPPINGLRGAREPRELLTELRPAVAVFGRFGELDFARAEGSKLLARYIGWVQMVVNHYEGILLQVTLGEKGNYYYAAFGAAIAHEDDAVRAVLAARTLCQPQHPLDACGPFPLGIAQGMMRVGSYGSARRRTYGVLGDAVNIAARLMQRAEDSDIVVSAETRAATGAMFAWTQLPVFSMKGKASLFQSFALKHSTSGASVPGVRDLSLPLIGRAVELARLQDHLAGAMAGRGRIVTITGEAGIGKSRLIAELTAGAARQGHSVYQGACQSYGRTIAYVPWQAIWSAIFQLTSTDGPEQQIAMLEHALGTHNAAAVLRAPLCAPLLNLPIRDNDLTRSLDPDLRLVSREALLVDYVRSLAQRLAARQRGLVIVLEDMQWSDALSQSLAIAIGYIASQIPLLLVLTYRPSSAYHHDAALLAPLDLADEITLDALSVAATHALVSAKLARFGLDLTDEQRTTVQHHVHMRTQGNPFFIEEVLNYLYRTHADQFSDGSSWRDSDLPLSVQSLILSRLDQLAQSQQYTLKVASLIGRFFRPTWLHGAYLLSSAYPQVLTDLAHMQAAQLIVADHADAELAYVFKHAITQEVIYESLTLASRRALHEILAAFIERTYPQQQEHYTSLLAFHYGRSSNTAKQIIYFRAAADHAKANYANQIAIEYYTRLLTVLPAAEQSVVQRRLGEVLQLIGQWPEAADAYQQALALAQQHNDAINAAYAQALLGRLLAQTATYTEALSWLETARLTFERMDDKNGLSTVLEHLSFVYSEQGQFTAALEAAEHHLVLARARADHRGIGIALGNLGLAHSHLGNLAQALTAQHQALAIATQHRDWRRMVLASNDLAHTYWREGDLSNAILSLQNATRTAQTIDYREAVSFTLSNMGLLYFEQGFFDHALLCYSNSLPISRDLGAWSHALALICNVGLLWAEQNDGVRAEQCYRQALTIATTLQNENRMSGIYAYLAQLFYRQQRYDQAQQANEQARTLAQVTQRSDIAFQSALLAVKLEWIQGRTTVDASRTTLIRLMETYVQAEHQAALYFTLWEIDPADDAARCHAMERYRQNYERSGAQQDQAHYHQLTGELLLPRSQPAPPPSFLAPASVDTLGALIETIVESVVNTAAQARP